MIQYQALKRRKGLFKNFTGLTHSAFEELLISFEQVYQADLAQADEQRKTPRQRQRGGGRHSYLQTPADKLVFILVYFRFYPVQVLQGYLFGMGQSQANEWIHRLTPQLNQALGYEQHLPARQTKDIKVLLAACPELEFIRPYRK